MLTDSGKVSLNTVLKRQKFQQYNRMLICVYINIKCAQGVEKREIQGYVTVSHRRGLRPKANNRL